MPREAGPVRRPGRGPVVGRWRAGHHARRAGIEIDNDDPAAGLDDRAEGQSGARRGPDGIRKAEASVCLAVQRDAMRARAVSAHQEHAAVRIEMTTKEGDLRAIGRPRRVVALEGRIADLVRLASVGADNENLLRSVYRRRVGQASAIRGPGNAIPIDRRASRPGDRDRGSRDCLRRTVGVGDENPNDSRTFVQRHPREAGAVWGKRRLYRRSGADDQLTAACAVRVRYEDQPSGIEGDQPGPAKQRSRPAYRADDGAHCNRECEEQCDDRHEPERTQGRATDGWAAAT